MIVTNLLYPGHPIRTSADNPEDRPSVFETGRYRIYTYTPAGLAYPKHLVFVKRTGRYVHTRIASLESVLRELGEKAEVSNV